MTVLLPLQKAPLEPTSLDVPIIDEQDPCKIHRESIWILVAEDNELLRTIFIKSLQNSESIVSDPLSIHTDEAHAFSEIQCRGGVRWTRGDCSSPTSSFRSDVRPPVPCLTSSTVADALQIDGCTHSPSCPIESLLTPFSPTASNAPTRRRRSNETNPTTLRPLPRQHQDHSAHRIRHARGRRDLSRPRHERVPLQSTSPPPLLSFLLTPS